MSKGIGDSVIGAFEVSKTQDWSGMDKKDVTPKVGVGVMIFKEGKVLLLKRKGSHGAGEWSLPGGHMELGESFLDTCKREVLEEVGVKIDDIINIDFTNDIFPTEGLHYVTLFFEAKWDSEQEVKNMEPDKAEEMGWFAYHDLPDNLFGPLRNLLESMEKNDEVEDRD